MRPETVVARFDSQFSLIDDNEQYGSFINGEIKIIEKVGGPNERNTDPEAPYNRGRVERNKKENVSSFTKDIRKLSDYTISKDTEDGIPITLINEDGIPLIQAVDDGHEAYGCENRCIPKKDLAKGQQNYSFYSTVWRSDVLHYISGYVAKKILEQIECSECASSLYQPSESTHLERGKTSLLSCKRYGNLLVPSTSVCKVVECVDKVARSKLCKWVNISSETNAQVTSEVLERTRNKVSNLDEESEEQCDMIEEVLIQSPTKSEVVPALD
eukprot:gene15525-6788_t